MLTPLKPSALLGRQNKPPKTKQKKSLLLVEMLSLQLDMQLVSKTCPVPWLEQAAFKVWHHIPVTQGWHVLEHVPSGAVQLHILPARSGARGRKKPPPKHPTELPSHQLLIISNEGVLSEAMAKQSPVCNEMWSCERTGAAYSAKPKP